MKGGVVVISILVVEFFFEIMGVSRNMYRTLNEETRKAIRMLNEIPPFGPFRSCFIATRKNHGHKTGMP
jgi:hypothetical protein